MRNLDRVWEVWEDLDKAYSKSTLSASSFLKHLVSNGDRDNIMSLLAKIANDINTSEDNKKFSQIQAKMLAISNSFSSTPNYISSLNEYVTSLLEGTAPVCKVSFSRILELVSAYKPYVVKSYDFDVSDIGFECVTSEMIHRVKLVSENAVIVPSWCSDEKLLSLTDSSFHQKVAKVLKRKKPNEIKKKIFVSKDISFGNKKIRKNKSHFNLVCGVVEFEVKML